MLDAAIRQISTTHKEQPIKSGFQRIQLNRKFSSCAYMEQMEYCLIAAQPLIVVPI
jgi:hypothetical protein